MNHGNAKVLSRDIISELHIGQMVERELCHQRRSVAWFASQLFCDRTNAYKLLKRRNIDIEQLIRISVILDHNFFDEIASSIGNTNCNSVE